MDFKNRVLPKNPSNQKILDSKPRMPFTKENPFVGDPLYFANRTHYIYTETTGYLVQVTYNWICFILGISLFLLMCHLLYAKTPDGLKSYRKILLLVSLLDLFILLNCLGVRFVSFPKKNI
jgi:hypothetical protein